MLAVAILFGLGAALSFIYALASAADASTGKTAARAIVMGALCMAFLVVAVVLANWMGAAVAAMEGKH